MNYFSGSYVDGKREIIWRLNRGVIRTLRPKRSGGVQGRRRTYRSIVHDVYLDFVASPVTSVGCVVEDT